MKEYIKPIISVTYIRSAEDNNIITNSNRDTGTGSGEDAKIAPPWNLEDDIWAGEE